MSHYSERCVHGCKNASEAGEEQDRTPDRDRSADTHGSSEAAHIEPCGQTDGYNGHWRNRKSKRVEKKKEGDYQLLSFCIVSQSIGTDERRDFPITQP